MKKTFQTVINKAVTWGEEKMDVIRSICLMMNEVSQPEPVDLKRL
jgi:hypothetical protein